MPIGDTTVVNPTYTYRPKPPERPYTPTVSDGTYIPFYEGLTPKNLYTNNYASGPALQQTFSNMLGGFRPYNNQSFTPGIPYTKPIQPFPRPYPTYSSLPGALTTLRPPTSTSTTPGSVRPPYLPQNPTLRSASSPTPYPAPPAPPAAPVTPTTPPSPTPYPTYGDYQAAQYAAQQLASIMSEPEWQALLHQSDLINQGLGFVTSNYNYQQQLLQQQNALQNALLDLEGQNIENLQADLPRDDQFITWLQQISQGQLGNEIKGLQNQAQYNQFNLLNDYLGRGAFFSPGRRIGQQNISDQLALDIQNAQLGYGKQDIGYQQQHAGIEDAGQALALQAQELGIKEDQLANALEQGLAQLGLSSFMDVQDLMEKLYSNNAAQAQLAMQIYTQSLALMGYYLPGGPLGPAPGTATPAVPIPANPEDIFGSPPNKK